MSSRKSNTQTTNQVSDTSRQLTAYGPAKSGIDQGLGMAGAYLNSPGSQEVYGGQRVADLSDPTMQGIEGLTNNAGYGKAADYYSSVLDGDYLNKGNPYLEDVKNSVMANVMPGINATFGRAGMTGSTIHQNQLTSGLSNAIAPYMFQAYEAERGRQQGAASNLPAVLAGQARGQLTAGSILDQHNQDVINADMTRFEQERTAPIRVVGEAMPYLLQGGQAFGTQSGTSNTSGTTTTESSQSPFQTAMGAAMMGLGAYSTAMNPAGAAMGAAASMGAPAQAASSRGLAQFAAPPVMPDMYTPPPFNPATYQVGGPGAQYF